MGRLVKGVAFVSVISSVTVTPNRVEIIARYLESRGERGVARDDLIAQLSPAALRRTGSSGDGDEVGEGRASVATEALKETLLLGLAESFYDNDTESVRFVVPLGQKTAPLLERLETILLDGDTAEKTKQHEFRRALAWLLAQNPERPIAARQNVSPLIEKQCGTEVNAFELTNESRAQNFYYWARYLGYAWYVGVGDSPTMIVPDPTAAIERHLSHLMSPGQTWPLEQLVASWGRVCPVLEGGTARSEVEELMQTPPRRSKETLSRSTSLALERLDRRGVIKLDRQADAKAVVLETWPDLQPFTHVTYLRTA